MSARSTLLRLLFPSWAFFNRAGAPPVLEVRAVVPNAPPGSWRRSVQPPRRRWWHLLFNPGGTLALAEQTLVERWHAEIQDAEETAVTRALVERLVVATAADIGASGAANEWQYRLRIGNTMPTGPDNAQANRDDDTVVLRALRP